MRRYIGILCLMIIPLLAWSQRDEDWKDFQKQHDFNEYKRNRDQAFQAYKDSINKEFARMIERKWEEYQVFAAKRRPVRPDPGQLPVAPKDSSLKEPVELPANKVISAPKPTESKEELQVDTSVTESDPQQFRRVDVNYYMQKVQFDIPVQYEALQLGGITEKAVAKFWAELSEGKVGNCLQQLQQQKNDMHLNDWALYDLIVSMARSSFANRYAEQTIFSVFVLNQLGLEAKIGRCDHQLVILIPAQTTLYAVSYVLCEKEPYYIFSCYPKEQQTKGSVNTYAVSYPKSLQALNMNINEPIHFVNQPSAVSYSTDFWGDPVPFQVNQNAIDFWGRYPQVDMAIYANAEMSDDLKQWADKQIRPFLSELDEYEAVNVLLYYVQTAFEYASDFDQFGFEKPFFCEENFYYSKNDCEDRAILFSYLVRNLVGVKIVLLDYPDHIATAVCLNDEDLKGDYYVLNGKKYYVCDPTYIGANIGESMPKYRKIKPDLIVLK